MPHPDVVIVGAGVVGASAAYHLAARGCPNVRLLDRGDGPGAGSTGRATGGFRAQFSTSVNVRLSMLSREKLRRFRDETGGDCGYVPAGYLWLASSGSEMAALSDARAVQHAEGLTEAVAVTAEEAVALNPALVPDGIAGGAYCPTDGFIRPLGILEGYLDAAARLGARIEWDADVTGVERSEDGRATAVRTARGTIAAGVVVNAAGAWASDLAQLAGLEVPVVPLRRQVAVTVPTGVLPASMPMTIFAADGFHLRVREGRVLLLWPTPGVPGAPYDTRVEPAWIAGVKARADARVPVLRDVAVDAAASWAGLYEMSPDRHAILGAAPECPNFYFANGSSGHGVMHAPALGHLLAEMILDGRATTIDATPLRPSRFAGELNPVSELL